MSEPIKVGDLVQVVRGTLCCHKPSGKEGTIFVVDEIDKGHRGDYCLSCYADASGPNAYGHPSGIGFDLARLRRIPPLTEPETTEQEATA